MPHVLLLSARIQVVAFFFLLFLPTNHQMCDMSWVDALGPRLKPYKYIYLYVCIYVEFGRSDITQN